MEPVTNTLLVIFVPLNTLFVLSLAYYVGKYVQRVEDLEKKFVAIEQQNLDVSLARIEANFQSLSTRFDALHRSLHDIKNFLMSYGKQNFPNASID